MLWDSHFARLGHRYEGDVMGLCNLWLEPLCHNKVLWSVFISDGPNMTSLMAWGYNARPAFACLSMYLILCGQETEVRVSRLLGDSADLTPLTPSTLKPWHVDLVKFPTGGSVKVFFIKRPVNIGLQFLHTLLEQWIINNSLEPILQIKGGFQHYDILFKHWLACDSFSTRFRWPVNKNDICTCTFR